MNVETLFPTFVAFRRWLAHNSGQLTRTIKRFLLRVGLLLAFAGVVLGLVYLGAIAVGELALRNHISKLKDAGEPLEISQLVPQPIPDSENAALVYRRAFQLLKKAPLDTHHYKLLFNFISPDKKLRAQAPVSEVRALLQKYEEALKWGQQAASMPKCLFPVNWEAGINIVLPHSGWMRHLVLAEGAHARLSALDGQPRKAVKDLHTMLGIIHHIGMEPTILSGWQEWVYLRLTGRALRSVLEVTPLSEQDSRELAQELTKLEPQRVLIRALQGERVLFLQTLKSDKGRQAITFSWRDAFTAKAPRVPPWVVAVITGPLQKRDELAYLRYLNEVLEVIKEADTGLSAVKVLSLKKPPNWWVRSETSWIRDFVNKYWEAEAELALMQWALALNVYHQRTGSYPSRLSHIPLRLGWKLPKDPITGGEFKYQRLPKGYILYSIGLNGKDEGGKRPSVWQPGGVSPDDVAFSLG